MSLPINSFSDFLLAAKQQDQPQRLLFVFARAELPEQASLEERARFDAGQGGTLAPLMCVDKLPEEIGDFVQLRTESEQMGPSWQLLFAASLAGRGGKAPGSAEAEPHLNRMIEAIKQGRVQQLLAFDRQGEPQRLY
ncbi:ribonucleotide reductase subunit alpha [Chitinimonas viridis]|uniref:Ribonucleotide reductase subunit alpha n=1 Tax=Chitinimonas viridis TaxID=664880 RepID=A0ABT8B2S0_9NEIS|nr:ribonucleotide reductase subunit alpha [Chitinimonas viridis]MDN3576423.1 ribonucleotide reductase subunit alpha [Chitinimonas viridis]